MKRTPFAIGCLVGLMLARVADIATTYHFTPDLKYEGNPLVTVWGCGWTGLLLSNALLILFTCAATIYWWRRPLQYKRCDEVTNMWTFASWAYFRKVYPLWLAIWKSCYKLPKNWPHVFQLFGFVMPPIVIVESLWAVTAWFLIHHLHIRGFHYFWKAGWPLSVFWPLALVAPVMILFYYDEYQGYLLTAREAIREEGGI